MGKLWDELMDILSDITGIKEIDPDFAEEEEARIRAEIEQEMKELQDKINSSSAKERVAAEKRMEELKSQNRQAGHEAKRKFLIDKMQGEAAHEERMQQMSKREAVPDTPSYDKGRMASLVRMARTKPSIPSIPDQSRGIGESERDTAERRPL